MFEGDWVPSKSPEGADQWNVPGTDKKWSGILRLTADLALVSDPIYKVSRTRGSPFVRVQLHCCPRTTHYTQHTHACSIHRPYTHARDYPSRNGRKSTMQITNCSTETLLTPGTSSLTGPSTIRTKTISRRTPAHALHSILPTHARQTTAAVTANANARSHS